MLFPVRSALRSKSQIALVTADPYRIAVALASGFQCRSLTDIRHTVYLIFFAVLPSNDPGKHRAVSGKISFDGYIYFQRLIHRSSLHHPAPPCWRENCSAPGSAALSVYSPSTSEQGDPPAFPSRIRASLYVLFAHRGRSCSDADMLFFLTRYPIARTTRLSVWMLAFSPSFVRSSARVMSGVSSMH